MTPTTPSTPTGPATSPEAGFVSTAPVTAPNQPHHNISGFEARDPRQATARAGMGSYSLVLASDGQGWCGTYGVVLAALLCDLLPEAALEACVTYLDDEEVERTRTGWIVGFTPDRLLIDWADGTVTDGHQVLALAI